MNQVKTKKVDFPIFNYKHLQQNLRDVVDYIKGEGYSNSLDEIELKKNYIEVINELQDSQLAFEEDIIIEFNNTKHTEKMLKNELIDEDDLLNNKHLFDKEQQEDIEYRIKTALRVIKSLNENLYTLIKQHISTIYVIKKDGFGGGSVSGMVGFIWLNVQQDWTVIDIAEHLYHEFIHNVLFIDDMVNCIFPDPEACGQPEALVTSPILKWRRPLDRSYHAACVAIGIQHMYFLLRDNREDRNYFKDLSVTISELNEKTSYLGEQGIKILTLLNEFLKVRDFNDITDSLNHK
ncbi:aKG-HExxH-type peptide beta-hydroxylase [Sutcliffiella cohnii]